MIDEWIFNRLDITFERDFYNSRKDKQKKNCCL